MKLLWKLAIAIAFLWLLFVPIVFFDIDPIWGVVWGAILYFVVLMADAVIRNAKKARQQPSP
jgi:uncharacterized membrane protein YGL010W